MLLGFGSFTEVGKSVLLRSNHISGFQPDSVSSSGYLQSSGYDIKSRGVVLVSFSLFFVDPMFASFMGFVYQDLILDFFARIVLFLHV